MVHPLAGTPLPRAQLVDVAALVSQYYTERPDVSDPSQAVRFGTSGHRGRADRNSFNEDHILAITQAICDYRRREGIEGPLFLGKDTHALSTPAHRTALEVLIANDVDVRVDAQERFVPTPVISHSILKYNRALGANWQKNPARADGIVVTPSHNPPTDGGFKYNPPSGGPASADITRFIETRANEICRNDLRDVRRLHAQLHKDRYKHFDYIDSYVSDLPSVIDLQAISDAGLHVGVDPLGGSGIDYWSVIADRYKLNLEVVGPGLDQTFGFMPRDHDGVIRMDCSSRYAMHNLISLKDRFDVAFGNDPDYDRHGIVVPSVGLVPPNHFLVVASQYLFQTRGFAADVALGKTLVSSSMIDRAAALQQRKVVEVPVGFKWFVDDLLSGHFGFAGEESAGASFLRKDATAWTTDKDGIILDLLAAESLARTGKDAGILYSEVEAKCGVSHYARMDAPASLEVRQKLGKLSASAIHSTTLAGEAITAALTEAPGNGAPIGGLKVVTPNAWFAARPSGTEAIYKIYAESFISPEHLARVQDEAQSIVADALK